MRRSASPFMRLNSGAPDRLAMSSSSATAPLLGVQGRSL
jgi:hypothetical protein